MTEKDRKPLEQETESILDFKDAKEMTIGGGKRKAEEERKAMLEARAERERKEAEAKAIVQETEIKESDEVEEVAEVEQPSTHEEEHEKILSVTFTVRGTRAELIDLSNFLKELNYDYKQIK